MIASLLWFWKECLSSWSPLLYGNKAGSDYMPYLLTVLSVVWKRKDMAKIGGFGVQR